MSRRTTGYVKRLKPSEIFVFGSNLSGVHGKGAAKQALQWGAKIGIEVGMVGSTYAIPTKDVNVRKTLSRKVIERYVDEFIEFAKDHPNLTFLVTEIGCGLAGLTPEVVAPMFKNAVDLDNVKLPKRFWTVLNMTDMEK